MKIETSILTAMALEYHNYIKALNRWMSIVALPHSNFGFFCVEDEI